MGIILFGGTGKYPGEYSRLINFYPRPYDTLPLPSNVPKGISAEFREAEKCLGNGCYRAASALFRSVLDKILLDNGYKKQNKNLKAQIDDAATDGIITQARKNLAHSQIRVLGNDILHDEYKEISQEDAEAAKHYCQRILEDFYDDRESVLKLLRELQRISPP